MKDLDRAFPPTPDYVRNAIHAGFRKGERRARFRRKLAMAGSAVAAVAVLAGMLSLAAPRGGPHRPDIVRPSVFKEGVGTLSPDSTGDEGLTPLPSGSLEPSQTPQATQSPWADAMDGAATPAATVLPTAQPTEEPFNLEANSAEMAVEATPSITFIPSGERVYSSEISAYYHIVPDCPGANAVDQRTFTEAEALGQAACPICVEGMNAVFCTEGGRYYHTDSGCSGMVGATMREISMAEKMGKSACPVCVRGEQPLYSTETGRYYHSDFTCSDMVRAIPRSKEEFEALGQTACPICVGAANANVSVWAVDYAMDGAISAAATERRAVEDEVGMVYSAEDGATYHAYPGCSGTDADQARLLSEAKALGQTPCPVCMNSGALGITASWWDGENLIVSYNVSLNADLLWLTEEDLPASDALTKAGDWENVETYLAPAELDLFYNLLSEGKACGFRRGMAHLERADGTERLAKRTERMEGGETLYEIYPLDALESAQFTVRIGSNSFYVIDGSLYTSGLEEESVGASSILDDGLYSLAREGDGFTVYPKEIAEENILVEGVGNYADYPARAKVELIGASQGTRARFTLTIDAAKDGEAAEGEIAALPALSVTRTDSNVVAAPSEFRVWEDGSQTAQVILTVEEAEEVLGEMGISMEESPLLYVPDENFMHLTPISVNANMEADGILELLYAHGALPQKVEVLSFSVDGGHGALDLSAEFGEMMRSTGTSGENLYMGSVVNTFLFNYNLQDLMVYSNGQIIKTGHAIYDEPLNWY